MSNLKIVCLALGSILWTTSISWAAKSTTETTETMVIETYYPAPYGSYNELQLYPHNPATSSCTDNNIGTLYYDDAGTTLDASDDKIMACMGSKACLQVEVGRY